MPEKPPSLRERQAQLTRDEILKAARRLFAERGYAKTSVRDVAEAAGVSAQTVYDSIGSKQALVARLNDLIDAEAGVGAIGARTAPVRRSDGGGRRAGQGRPGRSSSTAATSSTPSSPGRRPSPSSRWCSPKATAATSTGARGVVERAPVDGRARRLGRLPTRPSTRSPRSPTSGSRSSCARATAGRSTASRTGSPPPAARCCSARGEWAVPAAPVRCAVAARRTLPGMSTRRGARPVPRARPVRPAPRGSTVDPVVWRCRRALARIEPQVDAIVAEHATSFWQRGARRYEDWPRLDQPDARVRWVIDKELVLELRVAARGAADLVVHDFSLIDPLRRGLRTRHVRIRHAVSRQ